MQAAPGIVLSVSELARQYAEDPGMFEGGGGGGPIDWVSQGFYPAEFSGPNDPRISGNSGDLFGGGDMSVLGTIGTIAQTAGNIAQQYGQHTAQHEATRFEAEAYPLMLRQAQSSGLPVDAFWFGEILRVFPGGGYVSLGSQGNLQAAFAFWDQEAQSTAFYVLKCGGQGTPLLSGCSFVLYGQGKPAAAAPGYLPSGNGGILTAGVAGFSLSPMVILLIVAAGLIAYLVWGQK